VTLLVKEGVTLSQKKWEVVVVMATLKVLFECLHSSVVASWRPACLLLTLRLIGMSKAHNASDFSPFYNYNVSIYVNKFPHISLIKITNMYIVSVTHFMFIQGHGRRCMSPICMQPFSTFLLLHKAVLEMDSLLLLSRQLLILQVPVLRLTYTMKALLSVLAWTNGGT
jgi:hypothetical protein